MSGERVAALKMSSGNLGRTGKKIAPARADNSCDSGADHLKGVAMESLPYPLLGDE